MPLKAKRVWKLCALYPSLKDSYWLSLNYGMQEAARRYGVDLKSAWRQAATASWLLQQAPESTSVNGGAQRPFCWVVARRHLPTCKSGSKCAGDRTGKCS
ncbi:hypothetical protein ACULNC_24680 [Shigella flexneri]